MAILQPELKTSVELIAGASDYFKYVDFPGDSTEKLAADQHKALDELKDCDGVLVLGRSCWWFTFQVCCRM